MKRLFLIPLLLLFTLAPLSSRAKGLFSSDPDLADVAEKAVGSVVNVARTRVVRYRNFASPFSSDPFFRQFFGDDFLNPFGVPREKRERSLGSGVLVSRKGHILTNHHVVAGASELTIPWADGSEIKAKLIGADPPTDVALLQAKIPGTVDPIPLGDSDRLRLAETVLAIGSPFGLGGTVTLGIVSAKGRANVGIADYEDFIQTDAAINPGNSGGALINLKGELVGINTAIYSRSGGYQGIGFAIPINMARHVMEQLIQKGEVTRGWLGVLYQDLTPDLVKALGLKRGLGVLVTGVYRGSPAHGSGIERGDVILGYNKDAVRDAGHFSKLEAASEIGGTVALKFWREGKSRSTKARIQKRPEQLHKSRR